MPDRPDQETDAHAATARRERMIALGIAVVLGVTIFAVLSVSRTPPLGETPTTTAVSTPDNTSDDTDTGTAPGQSPTDTRNPAR